MKSFNSAFDFTLKEEGGFVLSTLAHDTGGQTYAGVARNKQPQWPGWALIDRGDRSSERLKSLVREFYLGRFWLRNKLDLLTEKIGVLVFDFAVNSGDTRAVQMLQREVGADADGKLGPVTAKLVAARDVDSLAINYLAARLDFLNDLGTWQNFGRGWAQRVVHLMRYAGR